MYTVKVQAHFQASHQLTLPDGSKEDLHSHDWAVLAEVGSKKLNSMAIVMDFRQLKKILSDIVSQLEDKSLDTLDYFRQNIASAELIARYIYEHLEANLPDDVRIICIEVAEEQGFSAKYSNIIISFE